VARRTATRSLDTWVDPIASVAVRQTILIWRIRNNSKLTSVTLRLPRSCPRQAGGISDTLVFVNPFACGRTPGCAAMICAIALTWAAPGEPPNDIVQGVLRTNVPGGKWTEILAAPLGADYAMRSIDSKYLATLNYTGALPKGTVWTMTVQLETYRKDTSHNSNVAAGGDALRRAGARLASSQPVVVLDKQFGLFSITNEHIRFVPSSSVPLIEDQVYGWRLRVNTERNVILVRDELELPLAPTTWGDAVAGRTISEDGRTSIMTRSLTPDEGYIFNMWTIAHGDPLGGHVVRVFIDDKPVATFHFTVINIQPNATEEVL